MSNMNSYDYILKAIYNKMKYYRNMIKNCSVPYEIMYYKNQLYNERMHFINHLNQGIQLSEENEKKIFTALELAQYDGTNGRPAYVAVNGIVYDVSLVAAWEGGTHFGLYAGKDLSEYFNVCHAGRLDVLNKLLVVGVLQE